MGCHAHVYVPYTLYVSLEQLLQNLIDLQIMGCHAHVYVPYCMYRSNSLQFDILHHNNV